MKYFLNISLCVMAALVCFACANEEKDDDNGSSNNGNGTPGCEEGAYLECYNATTAQQCIDGEWQKVRCASDEVCSSSTRQCTKNQGDNGNNNNNGGNGDSGNNGGSGNNGDSGNGGNGNTSSDNYYGPNEWWKNIDISKVKDLNDQQNVAGVTCDKSTFRESCNNGTIMYCENGTVKQYDCKKAGYTDCAYFPSINFADCITASDECTSVGQGISGCSTDNDYYDFFYNGICATASTGKNYWVYENSYCSGICSNDKGCPVKSCSSNVYKANCDGEYGYICYENIITMLNCHQLSTQCAIQLNNPECQIDE